MWFRQAIWIFLFTLPIAGLCQESELTRFVLARPLMGTTFRIILYAPDGNTAKGAAEAAFARVRELNSIFSDYDPKSEISQLSKKWKAISPELNYVLQHSLNISELTAGAFDISMGQLTGVWREAMKKGVVPDQKLIKKKLKNCGYKHVQLKEDQGQNFVRLRKKVQLDFGGIAKGYAIDEALRVMKEAGVPIALVDGGGDLSMGDSPPGRKGWRISRTQVVGDELNEERLWASNCSIASSGDAFRYVEAEGKRYSHIINPITGYGITNPIEVSVMANNCLEADAWATGISAMGANHPLLTRELFDYSSIRFIIDESDKFEQIDLTKSK